MTLSELVSLLANKLSSLNNAKSTAIASGEIAAVLRLEGEIAETQDTLRQLQSIP